MPKENGKKLSAYIAVQFASLTGRDVELEIYTTCIPTVLVTVYTCTALAHYVNNCWLPMH